MTNASGALTALSYAARRQRAGSAGWCDRLAAQASTNQSSALRVSIGEWLVGRYGRSGCDRILKYGRMIFRKPPPHAITNHHSHGKANQQDAPCGGPWKDLHQGIHGVHGGVENRRSQDASLGSVVGPAK